MYSNNSIGNQHIFVSDGMQEVVTVNMNSNSNEPTNYKSQQNDDQTIAHEYIATQIVSSNNYIPNELLQHHSQHHHLKKLDFQSTKDSGMIVVYSSPVQDTPTQLLTTNPMTAKYVELGHEESQMQMIAPNDDSDKSDCETNELHDFKSKHVKRSLPHKKRLAKRLVSDNQPYTPTQEEHFGIVLTNEETNNIRFPQIATYDCTLCPGVGFVDQFQFYKHLKMHYEADAMRASLVDQKSRDMQQEVGENLIINHQSNGNVVPENLIESLDDTTVDIKSNIPQVIDEFNEFSEPEDMMEDFRKEVEKVVKTIGENDCVETSEWFEPNDEMHDEPQGVVEQNVDLQIYQISNNVVQQTFDHIQRTSNDVVLHQPTPAELKSFDHDDDYRDDDGDYEEDEENEEEEEEEDEDDKKTLEQLRKETMEENKSPSKTRSTEKKKPQVYVEQDKEDIELNECLKKINNFKCTIAGCWKTFNSRTALGYHLKTHTMERRFVCDQCGKKFLTNGALKVHIRLHTDDRPYKCKSCDKSFRQWGDLKYHETSIHSNKKDHICEFCAKAFARKYSLVIHRRIHTGERNYKCTDCDKSFRASSYLLNHRRIHTGEKPYVCSEVTCQKKFRVVGDLKRHMKIHERVKNGVQKEKQRKEDPKDGNNFKEYINNDDGCVDLRIKEEKPEQSSLLDEVTTSSKKSRRILKTKKTK